MNFRSIGPSCELGEGPLWHPELELLFWFDIMPGDLYSCDGQGGDMRHWNFGEPASAAGWVDKKTLIVATASGLQSFDIDSGSWRTLVQLEAENTHTRSNDGRAGPDGSLWVGTMDCDLEPKAGAYYRYSGGRITCLFGKVSIPNATCFSPDGKYAYLADSPVQIIWRWSLDDNGKPTGHRKLHIDFRGQDVALDGAICDAEGYLWNAQWCTSRPSRVTRYAPDGSEEQVIELPVSQPTCPALGGRDFKTLFVTSAKQDLSDEALCAEPDAGKVIVLDVETPGVPEYRVKLQ